MKWRALLFALGLGVARAATPMGGFLDHGVATPLSQHRGMVATVDGAGRDVMLVWLYDHRGGYALLMIDAETGKAEQFPTPYPWAGDGPFASLLSRANKFYTHFGSHFSEFDPVKRAFTFWGKTARQMAMSLTEADDGKIWAATYPNSGLVSFDPSARSLRDWGAVNRENWLQYPRSIAVDDAGWVYVGIGSAAAQLIARNPGTGETKPMLAPEQREHGYAAVRRDSDGKVRAQVAGRWLELHAGALRVLDAAPPARAVAQIAGDQGLFHQRFPSGKIATECDTVERTLTVRDPRTNATRTVSFEYASEGAHVIVLAAAPDGSITGGTAFPMRMFRFRPAGGAWENWPAHGQFNTVLRQGDRFFVGGYGRGFLLEWDPARAWLRTDAANHAGNPRFLAECDPEIYRPHDLVGLDDGRTIVLAGTPAYGRTGGGVFIWDREAQRGALLRHDEIAPLQSTMSLLARPEGNVLGGTTIAAGTGGEAKAKEAELYLLDAGKRRVVWRMVPFAGAQSYTDLGEGPRGLVYGFVDRTRFFVFDPAARRVVHSEELKEKFGSVVTGQGPRALLRDERGRTFVLFNRALARVDDANFSITEISRPPVAITAGGDILAGRLYFAAGSHMCSIALPE